jgi:GNAT superfamily N-acetyltransferase
MRYRWPENTQFAQVVLSVEQEACSLCQRRLHVCDHRFHPILSLQGPLRLVCKLAHCPDPGCPAHGHTLSPLAEAQLTLPYWLIGWDVFSWLGFRRFSRHWPIPQLQAELRDSYRIRLSDDAIAGYLQRYRCMVAARHQDQALLAEHYRGIDKLVLTIDGLQPEKGHETLYVVRELRGKRVWFAEPLLSSGADEVRRLIAKAKDWATQLGKPVELWMSDKQDAFVKGIEAEFEDVPHRYCQNHFLRDLAKPMLEKDSHAKVQMRKKVRGLRDIEKQVLFDRRKAQAEPEAASGAASVGGPAASTAVAGAAQAASPQGAGEPAAAAGQPLVEPAAGEAGQVVLDYCCAVRGILNDDQGGPLHPPGLRMAAALQEVRESLQRDLEAKKGGAARSSCASSRAASRGGCRK